jgi:hypothetical protein
MKNLKIKNLESLKSDLFKENMVDGFNIRGGYGTTHSHLTYIGRGVYLWDRHSD